MQKGLGITVAATAVAALLATAAPARADLYNNTFTIFTSEGLTNGQPFDTVNGNPFAGGGANTASANFTYSGPLNFNSPAPPTTSPPGTLGDLNSTFGFSATNISGYTPGLTSTTNNTVTSNGTVVADFRSLSSYLASSASSAPEQYGSYYRIHLGTVVAGTVLTIRHDDGISVFQGGVRVGSSSSGLTGATTDTIVIGTTGDTVLRYSRQNSTPSILQVAVPEPMSLGLIGAGLVGLGLVRRKKRAA